MSFWTNLVGVTDNETMIRKHHAYEIIDAMGWVTIWLNHKKCLKPYLNPFMFKSRKEVYAYECDCAKCIEYDMNGPRKPEIIEPRKTCVVLKKDR